jgi:hypothetical protein
MPVRGGSRGRAKESLNTLSRQHLRNVDFDSYLAEMAGESDRACALMACSALEMCLVELIETKFVTLSENSRNALFFAKNAPLSTLSSRIEIAAALGLVSESERADLECIRRVRNVFAHTVVPLSFHHELVAAECKKLKFLLPDAPLKDGAHPRHHYMQVTHSFYFAFIKRVFVHQGSSTALVDALKNSRSEPTEPKSPHE